MIQVIRYIKGYLAIRVWGFSPERFMNLCSNHNIFLWDIENHGEYYTMKISLKGFFKLKGITRKTGTRVAVTQRYGLPIRDTLSFYTDVAAAYIHAGTFGEHAFLDMDVGLYLGSGDRGELLCDGRCVSGFLCGKRYPGGDEKEGY